MLSYAGIGNRNVPEGVLDTMRLLGKELSLKCWILRLGSIFEVDTAFSAGCGYGRRHLKESYEPWKGCYWITEDAIPHNPLDVKAEEIAKKVVPKWDCRSEGARQFHIRSVRIMLGTDLNNPVTCVVCWTPFGCATGESATAIHIAQLYDIPVFNLYFPETLSSLREFVLAMS